MPPTSVKQEALRLEQAKQAIKKMKQQRQLRSRPAVVRPLPVITTTPSQNGKDIPKESVETARTKPPVGFGILSSKNNIKKSMTKPRRVSFKQEFPGDSVAKGSTREFVSSKSTDSEKLALTLRPKKSSEDDSWSSGSGVLSFNGGSKGDDEGTSRWPAARDNQNIDSPFIRPSAVTKVYVKKKKPVLFDSSDGVAESSALQSPPSPRSIIECEEPESCQAEVKQPSSSMVRSRKIKPKRTFKTKKTILKRKERCVPMSIKKTSANVKCPVFSVSLDESLNRNGVKSYETSSQFSNKNRSDTFTSRFHVTTVSDSVLSKFEAIEEDESEECDLNDVELSSPSEDDDVQLEGEDEKNYDGEDFDEERDVDVEDDEELMNFDSTDKEDEHKIPTNDFSRIEFHIIDDQVILQLRHPAALSFYGQVDVEVLKGSIEVLGYLLTPGKGSHTVFSPRGSSLLTLQTVSTDEVSNVELSSTMVYSFVQKGGEDYVFLLMKKAENTLSLFLEQFVDINLFPDMASESSENMFSKVSHKLQCCFGPNRSNVFQKGETWDQISQDIIEKPGCSVLCGGKGVGKSTMLRFLVNRFLSSGSQGVLLIDLDPGQAEVTIPGCVSMSVVTKPLLGPNFTHLQNPLKCIYVGDINISNCVSRYMDACSSIVHQWQSNEQLREMPCLVNTMGFNKGIGVTIMVQLLSILQPTRVVQILSRSSLRNYPELMSAEYVKKSCSNSPFNISLNVPRSCLFSQTSWDYDLNIVQTEADMGRDVRNAMGIDPCMSREIALLSYLAQMVSPPNYSILSVVPYCCPLDSIYLSICHESVPPSITLSAFNANLVALCTVSPEEQDVVRISDPGFPPVITKRFITDCLGFGIVRGIDMEAQQLYLLTPVPPNVLISVNCLVLGAVSLPQSVYFAPPREPGPVPYVIQSESQHSNQQSRRNFQFTYFNKYNVKA